ncbi:hypothetical protein H6792_00430 [Candidatus Nomurabacteria bacterium]|nr:hypothetical protein [Candidatus Nomurabacteria bacterium]
MNKIKIKNWLRRSVETLGLPPGYLEGLLSDGSDADASVIVEEVVLDFGSDPLDLRIFCKLRIIMRYLDIVCM